MIGRFLSDFRVRLTDVQRRRNDVVIGRYLVSILVVIGLTLERRRNDVVIGRYVVGIFVVVGLT